MASKKKSAVPKSSDEDAGEMLVAWQKYTAMGPDELSLNEGDMVELVDTEDPTISAPKKIKLDPTLEIKGENILDSSAAKHKLSVKPKRSRASSRYSPSRTPLNARWLVKLVKGDKRQGWVPCQVLQTADDPQPGTGIPGDASFRRQAVVKELVETEQEFVRDLDYVVQKYLIGSEREPRKPKIIKDNFDLIFGNLKEISEFHRTVLMEGVKYYANEPHLLGKAFLRLERDFDKHVNYCKEEPLAQSFLESCDIAKEYFEELSNRLGDDKTISEHLKLPIQRINDYQLLLKELVRYSACLGEDHSDLQKALELMLSVPHRAQDDKFTNSIEGYRGSIHKLGRLLAHDWFSVCFGDITKERYLFLFKARILISKVRRISDDRSVFQLKDIIKLPQVEIKDHQDDPFVFELIDKTAGHALTLTSHRDDVKQFWLKEIKEFATEAVEDDIQILSQPASPPEPAQGTYRKESVRQIIQRQQDFVQKSILETSTEESAKVQTIEEKSTQQITQSKIQQTVSVQQESSQKTELKVQEQKTELKVQEQKAEITKTKEEKVETKTKVGKTETKAKEEKIVTKLEDTPKQAEKEIVQKEPTQVAKTEVAQTTKPTEAVPVKVEEKVVASKTTKPTEAVAVKVEEKIVASKTEQTTKVSAQTTSITKVEKSESRKSVNPHPSHPEHSIHSSVLVKDGSRSSIPDYGDSYRVNVEVDLGVHEDGTKVTPYGVTENGDDMSSYGRRSLTSSTTSSRYSTAPETTRSFSMEEEKSYSYKRGSCDYDSRTSTRRSEADSGFSRKSFKERKSIRSLDTDEDSYSRRAELLKMSIDEDEDATYVSKMKSYRNTYSSIENDDIDDDVADYLAKIRAGKKSYTLADEDDTETTRKATMRSYSRTSSAGIKEESEAEIHDDDNRFSKFEKYSRKNSSGYSRTTSIENDENRLAKFEKYSSDSRKSSISERCKIEEINYSRSTSIEDDYSMKIAEDEKRTFSRFASVEDTEEKSSTKKAEKEHVTKNASDSFQTVTQATKFDGKVLEEVVEKHKKETSMAPPDETPKFTKTIGGVHIQPGQSTVFEIKLHDTPDSLTWLRDNRIIEGDLATRIKISSLDEHKTWRLEITRATEKDAGSYTAVACNAKGKSTCTTHLQVHTLTEEEQMELLKPDFVVKLKDTELLEDTYLRFMLKVKGDPHPTLTFFKDGVKIQESDRIQVNRDHMDHDFYELVMPDVKPTDAGVYKCVAKNEHGEATTEAKVTVTGSKHLFDDIVDKDSLLPKGEKPEFIWRKDGAEFNVDERFKVLMGDDEDSLALIFQHVKPEDAGLYTCVAQTTTGNISCSAELTVQGTVHELHREPEKPQLIIEVREAISSVGAQCLMELQVKGFPKPKVTWTHEGKVVEPSSKYKFLYEDEESMSLMIKNVQASDAGKYEITAENDLGQDIREMHLTVKAPPSIAKMADTTASTEQELKMTCEVEGLPKPAVQFYKDGKAIKASDQIAVSEDGKKHTITIKKTTLKDSGSYSVVATNEMAQASQFWNLEIYCMPKILRKLGENKSVSQKTDVELVVKYESEPAPDVTWYKDDKEIKSDSHYVISSDGEGTYTLKISGTVTTDSALYKVKAKNIHGSVEDEARVDVKRAPTITKSLTDFTVAENDKNVTLEVSIDSFPKPTVKWYLGEVEITESKTEYEKTEVKDGAKLVIKEVAREMRGNFTCKVSNELGEISTSAKMSVQCKPRITKQLKDTTVEEGATLHLEVEVDALPEPSLKWLRNGREVNMDARIKIGRDSQRLETYNLDVTLIKYEEQGEYEVVVTNALGTVSSKSTVTVHKEVYTDAEETDQRPIIFEAEVIENVKVKVPHDVTIEDVTEEPDSAHLQALPQILESDMENRSQFESLSTSFSVKSSGNPAPTSSWSHDGEPIKPGSNLRFKVSQDGDLHKLQIERLDPKDAGTYECTVSNCVGDIKKQVKLDIIPEAELRRPKVKEGNGLQDQKILKYRSCTMTAVIIGDPVPDTAWYFNDKKLTDKDFEEHKMVIDTDVKDIQDGLKECKFSLTIPKCERINGGDFTLKVKNKWGVNETKGLLTVVLSPEIEGPPYVTIVPGQFTELPCIIQANPPAIVTWTKSENVVEAGGHIEIIEDLEHETYTLRFKEVQLSDEGYYKVYAKNEYGEATSEGRIRTMTEKPKFITGLIEAHVEHGGEVSLMVRADGLPMPQLKWFLNGIEITDAPQIEIATPSDRQITSILTIIDYQEKDSGIYKVTASNVVGDTVTSSKVSMLQTPPTFVARLEKSQDVNEGETLVLKAKVGGSPKPVISWFKDGEPINTSDPKIKTEVLPDGTIKLTIEKVLPGDSGAYKLVVKNPNGETAGLCAVAVNAKPQRPKFTKCIKDTKAMVGEPLKLSAKVSAHPPPEIKWLKDGVPVRASSNCHMEYHPDGTVALIVDNVRPEHAGKYTLLVSNKMGEISGDANVDVEKRPTKPEFVTKLIPQTVVTGFPVKFEVKAIGFPDPTITWMRGNAEVISDSHHIRVRDLPDGVSTLMIEACDEVRDAITYRAIAANEAGETETTALLTVKPATRGDQPEERPSFLHELRDVITDEGQTLVLEAPFTGNPVPSMEWTKDGVPLIPSDRILLTCDGRKVGLTVHNALPSDAGQYAVKIYNPLGSETSNCKASVHKIFQPPSFLQRFTDLQQLPKRDAKFPARVSGVPKPEVAWTKDGQPLYESDKYHIKHDGDMYCLYVNNCEPADEGSYMATAINKEGQDSCVAKLEVVKEIKAAKKCEPASFLKRIGDTELYKGMTAKFTACAAGIPEPTVEWYRNDMRVYQSDRIRMELDTNGLIRLTIAGIDIDDLGKYTCKIHNDYGSDTCDAFLRFDDNLETKKRPIVDQYVGYDKYMKSGAPMPISDCPIISRMTDRRCTVSWKPSIPTGPRVPVTYQLEMLEMPHGDWFTVRSGIRSCCCDVGNLEPFRDYKFRIRVENKYGISDPSPFAVTHRERLEPEPVKFMPYLPPGIDFRPETSPYFPKDFDIDRPPHDNMSQAPRFLRRECDSHYGVKDQSVNLFWFVYGYPKPKMTYYFNDDYIEPGGRFDMSYTRNGQATLFINKMLDRDVGWYEAVAHNEHGESRQRVRLEIAEAPIFLRRPDVEYTMARGKARFEAQIVGVPYPEIKWYKDWKPLANSTRIKIAAMEPNISVLSISDAIFKDEGLYSVSARNLAGSISSSAMLHVEENDLEYNIRTYNNIIPIKMRKRPYSDAYDIGDELGRGTQGVTYHAVERLNGRNYAAKIMHGRGDLKPFMYNEWEIMNSLHHRKLISLHDAYDYEDSVTLILELAAGGELVKDHLLKMEYYTESDIACFIRQMLEGLKYMHERGIGHMGLNIGDLLLSHPGSDELKITDFGLSRRIQMGRLTPLKYGVPEYVSPECANGTGTGLGHDMWSIGIITYILLSGRSPFRGAHDRETLTKIKEGKWSFEESWWSNMSIESRDFISKLLIYQAEGRMDVHTALRHPWLERADKLRTDEYRISSNYLRDYYSLYREWYDNASCRLWFRRRPLEGAFTHPSKMVYPPGERYTPEPGAERQERIRKPRTWEDQLPNRSPLNYEIGAFKSESHYQNGPDTYLLQLRDVDFPVRLREYMKVAGSRGMGFAHIVSNENGYDWLTPVIRERRRFTDVMDEEIDDERRVRISRYGSSDTGYTIRRLRHELGTRLDTYAEAEAFLESKMDGRLPFFREKPQMCAMQEGKDLEMSCLAVGDPQPVIQWFKNDGIIADSHRVKIEIDDEGRSHLKLCPALSFDLGMYKVVARNKVGQTVARTYVVLGTVPDAPDSPEATQVSDNEALLNWKQPKHDGHAPVICYRVQYKLADDMEWVEKANNIDHEFYLMRDLEPGKNYIFRLSAKNSIGWSDYGVASPVIMTQPTGSPKVQLSKAMTHLQQITDSGSEVQIESSSTLDYSVETNPVEWIQGNPQDKYNFISEVYRGKFAAVVKSLDKTSDSVLVSKIIDTNAQGEDEVEGEFAALRSLRHERIASLIEAYKSPDGSSLFILEKLQGADVLTYLSTRHEYSEQTVATIVTQVLNGLQYLHWRGLCHLDIQPDNVVMCGVRSVQVKLVDFGSAHRVTKLGNKVPVLGHPDYISPEVLCEEPAYPQTDIWSLGVLTYVMLSGTLPFKAEDANESRQNIQFVRYRFEHLYKEVSQEGVRFIMLLFKRHPNKRPTAEECHENRWLLPTDSMIKKRERAIFLGNRLKEYSEQYHAENVQKQTSLGGKLMRSASIQEELDTAPF